MMHFDLGAAWREQPLAVVDVETTGLDAATCRVTEVGIVRIERGQIAERWGTLVHPECSIPKDCQEITGITDAMVADKPTFRALKWEIWGRLRDRLFVAWNAPFDWGFVEAEFARCGLTPPLVPRLDPLVWSRQLMPNEKSHRLQRVADKLGVPLQHAHRAENDAEAAGRIALRFADKLPVPLEALLRDQEAWRKAQDEARAARAAARGGQPEDDDDEAVDSRQAGLFG